MTKSNVIGLYGNTPRQPNTANEEVVKQLEKLLEMAKSGEICGVASAIIYNDEAYTTNRLFSGSVSYGEVGRLVELQQFLLEELKN